MSKLMTHDGWITCYNHGMVVDRFKIYLRETPKFWISSTGRRFRKDGSLQGWGSNGRKLDMETIKEIEVTE